MDRKKIMLIFVVDVTSVIEMLLGVVYLTLNGPFHVREDSRKTRAWTVGDMRYFVSGVSLEFIALRVGFLQQWFPFPIVRS